MATVIEAEGDMPPDVSEMLVKSAELLDQLVRRDDLQAGAASMPSRELFFAEGIAFVFVKKGAAGIAGGKGHGFVISKVQAPEDRVLPSATEADAMMRAQWSAPMFIKAQLFGVGFALGYMKIQNCMIIDTREEVEKFAHRRFAIGGSIGGALGKQVGAHLVMGRHENKNLFTYCTVGGVSFDLLSMEGIHCKVDKSTMQTVYGEGWSAEEILKGNVRAPPGCECLYSTLNEMQSIYLAELRQAARLKLEPGFD